MELVKDKSKCCACTACKNICPKQAIDMIADEKGFVYPQINEDKCINCGLCKKVCFYNSGYDVLDKHLEKIETHAVKHKDFTTRMNSRSGGIFTALTDYILEQNGIVYGVGYKEHLKVSYQRATTKEARNKYRGSKYVQSELGDIFKVIQKDLNNNKLVLFSGTPCHVAGLVKYLGKKTYNNLFLIDIVCHGVPSPKMFKDYVDYLETKHNKKLNDFNFRDKTFGWNQSIESYMIGDKKYSNNIYSTLFGSCIAFRDSCYNCQFTNLNRPSDITIADCWGINEHRPDIDDNNGVSLVIVNTKKGKYLQEKISFNILDYSIDIKDYLQPRLKEPNKRSWKVNIFWKDYINNGFDYIVKNYTETNLRNRIKRKINIFIKRILY